MIKITIIYSFSYAYSCSELKLQIVIVFKIYRGSVESRAMQSEIVSFYRNIPPANLPEDASGRKREFENIAITKRISEFAREQHIPREHKELQTHVVYCYGVVSTWIIYLVFLLM